MSVALDANMTGGNGAGGQVQKQGSSAAFISSTGLTIGVSASLLIVTFQAQAVSGLTGTWGSSALSLQSNVLFTGGTSLVAAVLTLINPTPGAQTLTLSWTSAPTSGIYMGATSFKNTDTITGIKIADNATLGDGTVGAQSLAINTAAGDATLVAVSYTHLTLPTIY